MKYNLKNILLFGLLVTLFGCKKDNEYRKMLDEKEIYYPGVISKAGYKAGNLRTLLFWKASPDPNIIKYVIYWDEKRDSMVVNTKKDVTVDSIKVIVPNLKEKTYSFDVYSYDHKGRVSIPISIKSVQVFGPIYQSGIFNRGYDADNPYEVDIFKGSVKLKFNKPDSVNINTVIKYTNNAGQTKTLNLNPDSTYITLQDFKFGTDVKYQSSYLPLKDAIDVFTVANEDTFPAIKRIGDITALYIKNPGNPFLRSDNGTGKWGLPKDWLYNADVVNQNGNTGGGWSSDGGGVIHFETKNWNEAKLENAKVYQTFTLPAGEYAADCVTQGYGGSPFEANFVVAQGTVVPDITQLNDVLARFKGTNDNLGGTHTINFKLTQPTTIAIGWVVKTAGVETYIQFKSVKLRILN